MGRKERILLVGGGSGGHIIPNLAVASAIKAKKPQTEILYLASRNKLDRELLKASGLKQKFIFSGKWRRYFSLQNFIDPFLIALGFWQSFFILLRFRPRVVFSKGGYVSLPVVWAAFFLRIPIILHESDSRMGLANSIAARLAKKVCVAFPQLAQKNKKYVLTGNPLRPEILEGNKKEGYKFTGFNSKLPVLLVWGGSQGAQQINDLLTSDLTQFTKHFQVIHITGNNKGPPPAPPKEGGKIKLAAHRSPLTAGNYISYEYLNEELPHIYAITDLIIGRAGANSLFEVALLQKPNIIIPLFNADQLQNAHYFEEKKASLVYHKGQNLFDLTWNLWQNEDLKSSMRKNLKALSKPKAAEEIAKLITSY